MEAELKGLRIYSFLSGILVGLGILCQTIIPGSLGKVLLIAPMMIISVRGIPLYTNEIQKQPEYSNLVVLVFNLLRHLGKILLWNILGCIIISILIQRMGFEPLSSRVPDYDFLAVLIKSILAGIIITITNSKDKPILSFLGLFLVVYLGLLHTNLEIGYLLVCWGPWNWHLLWYFPVCILGNLIGGLIFKIK